ncbi:hypothetical protein ECZU29_62870 [Escherichia coli]|nr:hypothetical protein ECZU29_62870 [Escherichia coli]
MAAVADERKKLERLCRYISRPAVSEKRLSLTRGGNVCYQLKTPYRDGTTHVISNHWISLQGWPPTEAQSPSQTLPRVFRTQQSAPALVTPAKRAGAQGQGG